jgi:hypothetical protein
MPTAIYPKPEVPRDPVVDGWDLNNGNLCRKRIPFGPDATIVLTATMRNRVWRGRIDFERASGGSSVFFLDVPLSNSGDEARQWLESRASAILATGRWNSESRRSRARSKGGR